MASCALRHIGSLPVAIQIGSVGIVTSDEKHVASLNCDHHDDGVSIIVGAGTVVLLQGNTPASIAIRHDEPSLVDIFNNVGEV